MVSKKSFTLLADSGKIPIFTVFSIIFEQDCSWNKPNIRIVEQLFSYSNGICSITSTRLIFSSKMMK